MKAIATFKSNVEWFEYFYCDEKEIYSYEKGDGIDVKIIKAVSDEKEFLGKGLSKISELDKDATITFEVEINYDESKFEENLKILGLETNSQLSLQNIKKAHRTKAKEYHPDRNPGKDTTVEMQKINAAKEYLDANLEYYLSKKFQN